MKIRLNAASVPLVVLSMLALTGGGGGCGMTHPKFWVSEPYDAEGRALRQLYERAIQSDRAQDSISVKAAQYQTNLETYHLGTGGQLLYRTPYAETAPAMPAYGDMADQAAWSGALLGTAAERHVSENTPESRAFLIKVANGLHELQAITEVKGYVARGMMPWDIATPIPKYMAEKPWHRGTGEYAGWIWRGDTSKDQYAGIIYGYGIAYDLIDDEPTRARMKADVLAIAHHLMRHDLVLHGKNGEPTTYGNIRGKVYGVPVGLNALLSLAAYRVASHITKDEEVEAAYQDLVKRKYPQIALDTKFEFAGRTSHSNDNMAFLAYAALIPLETSPRLRALYQSSLARLYNDVQDEYNAFYDLIYAAHGPDPTVRYRAATRSHLTLLLFPPSPKRPFEKSVKDDPGVGVALFLNREFEYQAKEALLITDRGLGSWVWKSSPYQRSKFEGADGSVEFSGDDFLAIYWKARRYGFVTASQ